MFIINTHNTPIIAPITSAVIIIKANSQLSANFDFPSLISTPNVTAGLKCPPVTPPRKQMFANKARPTDMG